MRRNKTNNRVNKLIGNNVENYFSIKPHIPVENSYLKSDIVVMNGGKVTVIVVQ